MIAASWRNVPNHRRSKFTFVIVLNNALTVKTSTARSRVPIWWARYAYREMSFVA